ncbi:hypothetical protein [Methanoregula formicica]|uniref:hypothetical protein n=1 Tax=Methanoregula formicica TaxID=882104 RepID=UPI00064E41E7|nr:hypothetical protein [Methanoregula formicica]
MTLYYPFGKMHGEITWLLPHDLNNAIDNRNHRVVLQMPGGILDYFCISSKNPGWPHIALLELIDKKNLTVIFERKTP